MPPVPNHPLVRVLHSPSGRYAILARESVNSPWLQVESILGSDNAENFASDLQDDSDQRMDYIREAIADADSGEWSEDQRPTNPPTD